MVVQLDRETSFFCPVLDNQSNFVSSHLCVLMFCFVFVDLAAPIWPSSAAVLPHLFLLHLKNSKLNK